LAAFKEAFEELNPFGKIKELGRKVQFNFSQEQTSMYLVRSNHF
jgi:hypothetical protein